MNNIDPGLLWVLGVLVTFLTLLVGAVYLNVRQGQRDSDTRFETHRVETKAALEKADRGHEDLRKEMHAELEKAKDDAAKTHVEQWAAINTLKELFNRIDKEREICFQRHESRTSALENKAKENYDAIYKIREKTLLDLKLAFDNRMNVIEKQIADINQKRQR